MTIPAIGRNDPCPCGSGRKFKTCCLDKQDSVPPDRGTARVSAGLRQALASREFASMSEVQAFVGRYMQQQNQTPLEEFHGLSPEQMHRMQHFPFSSPELVKVPEVLNTSPTAPIMTLFGLLTEAIGEQGLKPTAKGNLPRKFCRATALAFWGEDVYQENTRFGGINGEQDFPDLHTTRLVAKLAGLIRKYKGRFILSRNCRALLSGDGAAAIYPPVVQSVCRTVQLELPGWLHGTALDSDCVPFRAVSADALRRDPAVAGVIRRCRSVRLPHGAGRDTGAAFYYAGGRGPQLL